MVQPWGAGQGRWEGDTRGLENIGPEDTFDGDYGRLLERAQNSGKRVASPTGPELNFSMPSVSEVVGWMERLETLRKTDLYGAA